MTLLQDADQAAMARIGEVVRGRLRADPSVYTVPVDTLELYAVSDFLSAAECDHFIGLIDAVARPSPAYATAHGTPYRTSYSGDVDSTDSFVRMVERRICDLAGLDASWGETVQGQRYQPGQEFKAHYDWFDKTGPYWPDERRRGGQRCWTAMAYLNEVDQGGETEFPRAGVSIPPQRGLLLLWNNARPDGIANEMTLHASLPVVTGTKYVITKWFRTRRWG